MPRLVLLRHAKSAYPDGVADVDRPLATRGLREAPLAGLWLHEHVPFIDRVTVSAATRALMTWELVDATIDFDGPVTIDPRVYDATAATLLEIIREQPDNAQTVLLVGHNPGVEQLVSLLAGPNPDGSMSDIVVKYPTSAIAVLSFEGTWRQLTEQGARLEEFAVPR